MGNPTVPRTASTRALIASARRAMTQPGVRPASTGAAEARGHLDGARRDAGVKYAEAFEVTPYRAKGPAGSGADTLRAAERKRAAALAKGETIPKRK